VLLVTACALICLHPVCWYCCACACMSCRCLQMCASCGVSASPAWHTITAGLLCCSNCIAGSAHSQYVASSNCQQALLSDGAPQSCSSQGPHGTDPELELLLLRTLQDRYAALSFDSGCSVFCQLLRHAGAGLYHCTCPLGGATMRTMLEGTGRQWAALSLPGSFCTGACCWCKIDYRDSAY